MKKIIVAVLALGFVLTGASGCAKEEMPAQKAVEEAAVTTDLAVPSVQETVQDLKDLPTLGGVTSAAQSSTQNLIREGEAVVDGVTSSAQSSTQALIRQGETVVGGVASAAQSSSQAAVQVEGVVAEAPAVDLLVSTQPLADAAASTVEGATSAVPSSTQAAVQTEDAAAETAETLATEPLPIVQQ